MSPDGTSLYLAGVDSGRVAHFSRDPATGFVTFVELYENGVGGVEEMETPNGIAVTPDGTGVYVAAGDALVAFTRDAATGALTFVDAHLDGVPALPGTPFAFRVTISPDSLNVHVGFGSSGAAVFRRDPATNLFTFMQVLEDVGKGVHVTANGTAAYGCGGGGTLGSFARDPGTGALTETSRVDVDPNLAPGTCFASSRPIVVVAL